MSKSLIQAAGDTELAVAPQHDGAVKLNGIKPSFKR